QRRRHAGRTGRPQGHAPAAARRRSEGNRRPPQGRARTGLCRGPDPCIEPGGPARRRRDAHRQGTSSLAEIPVDLAGRSYEVRVGSGLLADLPAQCGALLRKQRVPIVTDSNVAKHWRSALDQALHSHGFEPSWLVHEPGEGAKTWAGLERTMDWLLAEEV